MTSTLKTKVALLIVIIALILSGTAITITNRIISGIIDTNFRNKADNLAKTVALMVDNNAAAKLKSEILEVYPPPRCH